MLPDAQAALLRGHLAPDPRTLVDVLAATTARHPDALALDDGRRTLTYAELVVEVTALAGQLGAGPGDRVGIRLASGTADLYVAVLAVLWAGASYVPVDADDPDERARVVFTEAGVRLVLDGTAPEPAGGPRGRLPGPDDEAWVIFTSGSTGTPKGVAVTHRSAAAFVDAEAQLFLASRPLGPSDRVLAGLSVAFDASCEEMWLAWRSGACLVPAPRSLVRTGSDLGPWLVARDITAVSTVPTLAALWPPEALEGVRLLVFGGEACPEELATRLAVDGREVWNTYGPTETTVVACASRLTGQGQVAIGLPLDGWDLAVVDSAGALAETGELVIGGVGLARYLDPVKDATGYPPLPARGWERAYRSGDLVRVTEQGLVFLGRADDQVKLGGRRVELGEVQAALQALPGVAGAAVAVRTTGGGSQVLVGYVVVAPGEPADLDGHRARLREVLPAALVPLLAEVPSLPTRTSGKVDRDALPWPLPGADAAVSFSGTAGWLAGHWGATLGVSPSSLDEDFFACGGGSLTAARLVVGLRERHPQVTVADVYARPRLGALADHLDELTPTAPGQVRLVRPVPLTAQAVQLLVVLVLLAVTGLRWLAWLAPLLFALSHVGVGVPRPSVVGVLLALATQLPPVRVLMAALCSRTLTRGVQAGDHPRAGSVHLRIWAAEQLAQALGATSTSCAPYATWSAWLLGASVGQGTDLHAMPPVTGLLELGDGCAVEPETDLAGHWLEGDVLHVGRVRIGAEARVGTRSTLLPGADLGPGATLLPGSTLDGPVPAGQTWGGSPAVKTGRDRTAWPPTAPAPGRRWLPAYAVVAGIVGALPLSCFAVAAVVVVPLTRTWSVPLVALLGGALLAASTAGLTRLLGRSMQPGTLAVRSAAGLRVWGTLRLLDDARAWLFPIYSSLLTPAWLRLLGARVGPDVEASTVLLLPRLTQVGEGAFLADDTMLGSYELRGGWMRVDRTKVGKRAFLGNSGTVAPGRRVRKDGLVAVLSAAPERARPGASWLGSPPVRLRRSEEVLDGAIAYAPPRRLLVARGAVELTRLVPALLTVATAGGVLAALTRVVDTRGWPFAALLAGPVLLAAALAAAAVTTAAKWLLVGRTRADRHALWSAFVWRNEVVDTFVEVLAGPWLLRCVLGTPALALWLRSLGARVGRGVWCGSYWLPEPDLVVLGDAAGVERGCVLQTHLFHDRVLSTDRVELAEGASLGPHGVVLPSAALGRGVAVGAGSLVLRGDRLPDGTRWRGNPVTAA